MTKTTRRLTEKQRRALNAIQGGGDWPPTALAVLLDTGPEGAAATASSLVRKGLAERVKVGGHVVYRRTR